MKSLLVSVAVALLLSSCVKPTHQNYKDNFPRPCTNAWFDEIEREVNLVDSETGRPPAGSPQWLAALDEKYSISKTTSTKIGEIEWCHQIHQQFIGL